LFIFHVAGLFAQEFVVVHCYTPKLSKDLRAILKYSSISLCSFFKSFR
jgi:hypothetical protein